MIPMLCYNCGCLLRHKQIVYEDRMEKICNEMGVNYDIVSKDTLSPDSEYSEKRAEVVNELCEKICCRLTMITYVSIGKLIV